MSLWGATVITNLLSAIPWVGQDIVEFVWGGLNIVEPYYGNIILKILLNAGISLLIVFVYVLVINYNYVKITSMTWQPAGVKKLNILDASQRLHAGDLIYAYIAGLIEGDGYFYIIKRDKYVNFEFNLESLTSDMQLIQKIKNTLGIGIITYSIRKGNNILILKIKNRDHLKKLIIPLFNLYPMFSNKQYDYFIFKTCLTLDIVDWKNLITIPKFVMSNEVDTKWISSSINYLIDNGYKEPKVEVILNKEYFSSLLLGYIQSKGSFRLQRLNKINYPIPSFDISQKSGNILLLAIRKYLFFYTTGANIYFDKFTNSYKLNISNSKCITNLIKLIQEKPLKLLGNKRLQYLIWIKELRNITIYSKYI